MKLYSLTHMERIDTEGAAQAYLRIERVRAALTGALLLLWHLEHAGPSLDRAPSERLLHVCADADRAEHVDESHAAVGHVAAAQSAVAHALNETERLEGKLRNGLT